MRHLFVAFISREGYRCCRGISVNVQDTESLRNYRFAIIAGNAAEYGTVFQEANMFGLADADSFTLSHEICAEISEGHVSVSHERKLDNATAKNRHSVVYSRDDCSVCVLVHGFSHKFAVRLSVADIYHFVAEITGVDNVCERAAVKSAMERSGERPDLILKKTSHEGVTIAIAAEYMEVDLG